MYHTVVGLLGGLYNCIHTLINNNASILCTLNCESIPNHDLRSEICVINSNVAHRGALSMSADDPKNLPVGSRR